MHVLIIFILILGLVLARMSSPMLNEGLEGLEEEEKDEDKNEEDKPEIIPMQQPLYSGVW